MAYELNLHRLQSCKSSVALIPQRASRSKYFGGGCAPNAFNAYYRSNIIDAFGFLFWHACSVARAHDSLQHGDEQLGLGGGQASDGFKKLNSVVLQTLCIIVDFLDGLFDGTETENSLASRTA